MTTTHDPNTPDHASTAAEFAHRKTIRRRDESLSRHDALRLIREQTIPWGLFTSVGSGIAVILSVMSFQSTTTQDKIDKGTGPLQAEIVEMDKRLTGRLDAVDKRLDRFGTRMDAVEGRLGALEIRVGAMDVHIQQLDTHMQQIDAKLDRLLRK